MRWLIPVVLLSGFQARAHDADVIYVLLRPGSTGGVLVESVTLTAATLSALAPVDADGDLVLSQADLDAKTRALRAGFWDEVPLAAGGKPCDFLEGKAFLREGFVELQGEFRCGEGELHQDFKILRVLPANFRVVLGSQLDGEAQGRAFAQGSLTTVTVPRPPPPGSWDAAGFRRAFDRGVQKGLSVEVLAAVLALFLSIGAWRRGLFAAALLVAGAAAGSWAPVDWWPPTVGLLIVAIGAAAFRSLPLVVPALLGAAIGLREGGGGWPASSGLAVGTVLVLLLASPVAIAVGVMLQRRPSVLRVARWIPAVVALIAIGLHARLSW
jgi:hypothetical protein